MKAEKPINYKNFASRAIAEGEKPKVQNEIEETLRFFYPIEFNAKGMAPMRIMKIMEKALASSEAKIKKLKTEIAALKGDMEKGVPDEVLEKENEQLKKENKHMKRDLQEVCEEAYESGFKAFLEKKRLQALSELREEIEKIHHNWRYQIGIRSDRPRIIEANRKIPTQSSIITKEQFDTMWKEVLKAISSRRTA